MFSYLDFVYQWVLKRLPRTFSIPLLVLLILYFTLAFPLLAIDVVPKAEKLIGGQVPSFSIPRPGFLRIPPEYSVVGGIVSALLIVLVAVLGVLVCYGIASLLYRIVRGKPMKRLKLNEPSPLSPRSNGTPDPSNPLAQYERIGIILAGGGAKGAYQAGAMQAIYEFLEKHQALHKVRMIAGTSIGAWNSLFWLGGLVRRPDGNSQSVLEQWWHEVDLKSVIRFEMYMPMRQNYLLSPQPWQETFFKIFKDSPGIRDRLLHHVNHVAPNGNHNECHDVMHFYLTRANIALGKLEFTTNRDDLSNIDPNLPAGARPYQRATPDVWRAATSIEDLHDAVFASMDIPPLFKNAVIDDEIFEDGGVVDNLPMRFGTEFENCDLLFVLPLNASFAQSPDQHSIMKRLFRVMDVRQGVLERNSFKMVYLYNELAALREAAQKQQAFTTAEQSPEGEASAIKRAVTRKHKMVQVFSICPAPELLINTAEFWKTAEAGQAFRLMYRTTRDELQKFFYRDKPTPDWIRMARVSPEGEVTYLTDF